MFHLGVRGRQPVPSHRKGALPYSKFGMLLVRSDFAVRAPFSFSKPPHDTDHM